MVLTNPLFQNAAYGYELPLGYREYFGNIPGNISRMPPDIPEDMPPYLLTPFFFIIHSLSFKKIPFLKDR